MKSLVKYLRVFASVVGSVVCCLSCGVVEVFQVLGVRGGSGVGGSSVSSSTATDPRLTLKATHCYCTRPLLKVRVLFEGLLEGTLWNILKEGDNLLEVILLLVLLEVLKALVLNPALSSLPHGLWRKL